MQTTEYLFPKNIYPEYWFYLDRSQFSGTDVFEFYVGELFRSRMTWWNPGSEYVREEGLYPFLALIRTVMPKFYVYGENRFTRPQLYQLLEQLRKFESTVKSSRGPGELKSKVDAWTDARDFTWKQILLLTMADDFRSLCRSALNHHVPLWILGP